MNPAKIKEYMDQENTQTIPAQPTPVPVQSTQSVQSFSPTKKSKLPLILGILVLLGIVGVMGVVGGKYLFGGKTETVQPIVTVTTTTPTPTVDPAADWKTYTNTKYGFSFKYPLELNPLEKNVPYKWNDQIQATDILLLNIKGNPAPSPLFITIIEEKYDTFLKIFEENSQNDPLSGFKEENFQSGIIKGKIEKGTQVSSGAPLWEVIFPTSNNQKTFIIQGVFGLDTSTLNTDTFDQILSTFKFTDQNQVSDTTNWKTITLNKLSFKIPNTWWNSDPETDNARTGYSWINIDPILSPVPNDKPPSFALYYEQNKTPVQVRDEYIKQWGMTDVSESILKQSPADILLFEGNTQPGYLESKRFQVGIVSNGNDSYYLVDLTLVENHKQIFDQIISTFKFL